MPKLTPLSWRDLVARLRDLGFEGPFQGGRHPYMVRGEVVVTLPNPHRAEVGVDLLARVIRQAGLTREEWLQNE